MGSYANDSFSSSIAGVSDAGGLTSKKDGSGFVAAARRQSQMGVGTFAKHAHERLTKSAAFLSFTGISLWDEPKNDDTYERDQVA